MRSFQCSYLSFELAQLALVLCVFALNFASSEESISDNSLQNSRQKRSKIDAGLLDDQLSDSEVAPGWGKRFSEMVQDAPMEDDSQWAQLSERGKRDLASSLDEKLAPGWEKRAPGWGKRAPGWGKRAPGWGKRAPGWGKRAPGWGKRAPGWGKRAPGWGKRAPGWGKRAPGWGKRSEESEEHCMKLDRAIDELIEKATAMQLQLSSECVPVEETLDE